MKLAFTTLGSPDWSWERTLVQAVNLGFDGIEIRGLDGEMRIDKMPPFMPGRQQETLATLKKLGLTIPVIGSSVTFHDATKFEGALEEGRATIDVCARMGIPYIRVFGDQVKPEDNEAEILNRVVFGLQTLCDYAEGTGVGLLLECHGNFNTIERLTYLCENVKRDNFGILWDIEHSDKTYGDEWVKFYEALRPYIKHMHVKDYLRDGKYTLTLPGDGDIPIPDILKRVLADGYDGFFSFEWEKKWHPELPVAEIAYPKYVSCLRESIK